jgi:hypothetical protein
VTERKAPWVAIAVTLWACAMAGAWVGVWHYKTTPGEVQAEPPATLPAEFAWARRPGMATIVMLAHPRCPCTLASIGELGVLMARLETRASAVVLFMTPAANSGGWEQTESWRRAAAIPGVRVARDTGGVLASALGAGVSGHTLAYDAGGRLLFSGGITGSRGHQGDNAGRLRLEAMLRAPSDEAASAQIFGCELSDPNSTLAEAR